jgi:hypothetical protein
VESSLHFSEKVIAELGCYVYRLIDPRNGNTFYVGRGRGNRVFSHAAGLRDPNDGTDDEDLKLKTIRAIVNAGFTVEHVIHRHGMDEKTAAEVEAALIDAYPGATNVVRGSGSGDKGVMHAKEIVRKYEAQPIAFQHDVILINVNRSSEDSARSLYDAVRYKWKLSAKKAKLAKYVLAVRRGIVIGVYEAHEWLSATVGNFGAEFDDFDEGRVGFRGQEAPEDIKSLYIGKRIPLQRQGAANPIRYGSASHPTAIGA